MRLYLLAALLLATPALAGPHDTACTLKVAETLPRIAGLKIGKTRTVQMPTPAGWSAPPVRVEVDFTAAGIKETWVYLCAVGANGGAVVQRLVQ